MNIKKHAIRKLKNIQAFTPVLVVTLLVVVGAVIYNFNARAATAGFYFASPSDSYKVGETFNVDIYEDSGSDCANVVQADFSYPQNLLRYNSFSVNNSKFESSVRTDSTNGEISLIQYTSRKECGPGQAATSGVSGEQVIGRVSFTVLEAGQASLSFKNSSIAISAADNDTDVAPGSNIKGFTFTSSTVTPPPPDPPSEPDPNPAPPPPAEPADAEDPAPVTAITPDGSDEPIALQDNDVVEITKPIDVQPLPVQPDGIKRIEYYLSGDLVATVKTAPYTYKLDTTKYLNGEYTLTTKTFYANGQTKSVSQKLVVKNAFGWSQIKLWIQRFAWLVILVLLVIGAIVAAWIIHRRGSGPDYYGDGSGGGSGDYVVPNDQIVTSSEPYNLPPTAPEPEVYRPTDPSALK